VRHELIIFSEINYLIQNKIRNFARQMGKLEQFKVNLRALKKDVTAFDFDLDKDYFDAIDGDEINSGKLLTHLIVRKTAGVYELEFHTEGTVTVLCDLCLDEMTLPIETDNRLTVRFGETFQEDDDYITLPAEESFIDVAWYIYEFVALAIPIKHVHEEGGCNQDMIDRLNEMSATSTPEERSGTETDPRWKELEKLKTIIKD